jgi:hypothetical protein
VRRAGAIIRLITIANGMSGLLLACLRNHFEKVEFDAGGAKQQSRWTGSQNLAQRGRGLTMTAVSKSTVAPTNPPVSNRILQPYNLASATH